MKILKSCAIALAITTLPHGVCAKSHIHHEEAIQHSWGEVNAQGLQALLDSKVSMQLVDARADKWFDGTLIMGAKRLPDDSTEEVIEKTLPDKKQLIVAYCGGGECPASQNLAKRLVELGYQSVLDYQGGISEWKALKKPIQKL